MEMIISRIEKRFHALRQLIFPKEFRIGPDPLRTDQISLLEELAEIISEEKSERRVLSGKTALEIDGGLRFLNDLGTNLWRLRGKLVKPGTDEPIEEMKRAYRHFQAVWDVLGEAGVEIQDYTDTPFSSGMSLRVHAFQPMEGIEEEWIVETLKPSIYYKGRSIQMGEVIVGTPLSEGKSKVGN